MAEKPILFNTDMVKAILEGRKTTTRRVIKPQPKESHIYKLGYVICSENKSELGKFAWGTNEHGGIISKARPPYQIGDTLWVRETWGNYSHDNYYLYKADYPEGASTYSYDDEHECDLPKWRPSIHMPREAARIFLKVTDVRVERLQDIDSSGAWAEGTRCGCMYPVPMCAGNREKFIELWDGIYHNWNENPWVWVIEFERVR